VKLHDLRPAPGSRTERTRVGRGIAAGKGKTAGRGTKGQKARAGGTIPAWFEGGQTPLHMRVPKLRGFKQRDRVDYQVVNVGRISAYAEAGRFGVERDSAAAGGGAPVTVNSEVLRSSGLIGSERRPVKILGSGEVSGKLFVAADAFTRSARRKIEAAGGFVQLLAPDEGMSARPAEGSTAPVASDAEPSEPPPTPTPGATGAAGSPEAPDTTAGAPSAPRSQRRPAEDAAGSADDASRRPRRRRAAAEPTSESERSPGGASGRTEQAGG
jgi:large subunit ribosomal protein L15